MARRAIRRTTPHQAHWQQREQPLFSAFCPSDVPVKIWVHSATFGLRAVGRGLAALEVAGAVVGERDALLSR